MSESESEATTRKMTKTGHIKALWQAHNAHQKDNETLTRAIYMLHERLVVVENALVNVLTQHDEG